MWSIPTRHRIYHNGSSQNINYLCSSDGTSGWAEYRNWRIEQVDIDNRKCIIQHVHCISIWLCTATDCVVSLIILIPWLLQGTKTKQKNLWLCQKTKLEQMRSSSPTLMMTDIDRLSVCCKSIEGESMVLRRIYKRNRRQQHQYGNPKNGMVFAVIWNASQNHKVSTIIPRKYCLERSQILKVKQMFWIFLFPSFHDQTK